MGRAFNKGQERNLGPQLERCSADVGCQLSQGMIVVTFGYRW